MWKTKSQFGKPNNYRKHNTRQLTQPSLYERVPHGTRTRSGGNRVYSKSAYDLFEVMSMRAFTECAVRGAVFLPANAINAIIYNNNNNNRKPYGRGSRTERAICFCNEEKRPTATDNNVYERRFVAAADCGRDP